MWNVLSMWVRSIANRSRARFYVGEDAWRRPAGLSLPGLCAACMVMASCSSGDGNPDSSDPLADSTDPVSMEETPPVLGQDQTPDTGEIGVVGESSGPSQAIPDELADIDRVALVINASSRCSVAGESFDLNITRALTATEEAAGGSSQTLEVTPYVTLTQSLGTSLQLLSRTDEIAQFSMQSQDIVGLTAELDNGSVTTYLAAFAADAPESAVLRKPVPGGCLYAVRVPGYCATGLSKSGTLNFNRDGLLISARGCEMDNPTGLPVIELPPQEN